MKKVFEVDQFINGYQEEKLIEKILKMIQARNPEKDNYIIVEVIEK